MRLCSLNYKKRPQFAVVLGKKILPISTINEIWALDWPITLDQLLVEGQFDVFHEWVKFHIEELSTHAQDRLVLFDTSQILPLLNKPSKIWGIGLNYLDHAADLAEKSPEQIPASFMKATTTIIGHFQTISIPTLSQKTTGEAELGVIIKSKCKNVALSDWQSVVAGYTCIIDMTAEDILRKNPRYLTVSKNFDSFFSIGPVLITPDEIPDIGQVKVATVINGMIHAENTVAHMSFPPDFLVSFHSEVMTFLPGDVISTGTPRAVVLKHGDLIECRIEGFFPLQNPVVDLKEAST